MAVSRSDVLARHNLQFVLWNTFDRIVVVKLVSKRCLSDLQIVKHLNIIWFYLILQNNKIYAMLIMAHQNRVSLTSNMSSFGVSRPYHVVHFTHVWLSRSSKASNQKIPIKFLDCQIFKHDSVYFNIENNTIYVAAMRWMGSRAITSN